MTDVTDCGQFQERGRTGMHSEHANTRPSSRLTFSGKGSTAREDGLGTRLLFQCVLYQRFGGRMRAGQNLKCFCLLKLLICNDLPLGEKTEEKTEDSFA